MINLIVNTQVIQLELSGYLSSVLRSESAAAAAAQDRQTTQALRNETEGFKNTAVNAANQAIEYVATNEYVTRAGVQEITGVKFYFAPQIFSSPSLQQGQFDGSNSPIIVRERSWGGRMSGADSEAPNLTFFWNERVSQSVWVDAYGRFKFGGFGFSAQDPHGTLMFKKLILNSNVDSGQTLQVGGDTKIEGNTHIFNNLKLGSGFASDAIIKIGDFSIDYWNIGRKANSDLFSIDSYARQVLYIEPMSGNIIVNQSVSAASFVQNSSLRYKKNVETIENALDTVLAMRGVSYVRKDNGEKEIGFIAEEVHRLLPDVVVLNKEQQPDAIAYSRIIPVLVEAMKQQQEQIDELKKQDELRSKEIHDLKTIVNYLKTKL